jgi:nucleoid-associated protein YgaU
LTGGDHPQGPLAAGAVAPEGSSGRSRRVTPALLLWLLAAPALAVDPVHVVKPGETLWQIAANLTGNAQRWPELYRANRDQIKDPSRLYPGQRLAIPDFAAAPAAESVTPPAPPPAPGD